MGNYRTILCAFAIIAILSSCNNKQIPHFEWHQSYLGGGGYITGMVQDPNNPNIVYADAMWQVFSRASTEAKAGN